VPTDAEIRYEEMRDPIVRVPKRLRELLDRRGGQVQQDISWPTDRWVEAFPAQSVFTTLPPKIGRDHVRRACAEAEASEEAASDAFLATMAWGYGNVGYGTWRVARAFRDRAPGRKLLDVVTVLNSDGPQAAYRLMAGASRLHGIGPAFGTKFLYFADRSRHDRWALILDRLVADWLRVNTNFRVNPIPWAPARYDAYLDQMHDWAQGLEVEVDAVELAIFQEMSEGRSNQWART
jgi:hypothetical protein